MTEVKLHSIFVSGRCGRSADAPARHCVVLKLPLKRRKRTVQNQTIFVVDDDAGMRKSIQRLLRLHGFASRAFESVDAFFAQADLREALCIVVDVNLKGRSGVDVKRMLGSANSHLPVIFVTGGDCEVDRAEALDAGCVAFIRKPFTARALIDPIRRVARG
jgi:FixJ family two-component response regulator